MRYVIECTEGNPPATPGDGSPCVWVVEDSTAQMTVADVEALSAAVLLLWAIAWCAKQIGRALRNT